MNLARPRARGSAGFAALEGNVLHHVLRQPAATQDVFVDDALPAPRPAQSFLRQLKWLTHLQ